MISLRGAALALLALNAACFLWRGSGPSPQPGSADGSARLMDPAATYRSMGFLAAGPPLPFVASVHFLAGGVPDSTLLVVALSMPNQGLRFQRDGNTFAANYRVEAMLQGDEGSFSFGSDETVRVRTFQETLRDDESVIFQRFLQVSPGVYEIRIVLRDRAGPAVSEVNGDLTVPRLGGTGNLAPPLPVYGATPRASRGETPRLILNPRATTAYGVDTLRVYLEAYNVAAGTALELAASDLGGDVVWRDSIRLSGQHSLEARLMEIPPQALPVGRVELAATAGGTRVSLPVLVAFSDLWVTGSLEEMLSLLRYFGHGDELDSLRMVAAAERPAQWRRFWERTDPNRSTPEHEGLDLYFRRLQVANRRFLEPGQAGWLTDRGEVFITLGDPDEVVEQTGEFLAGPRAIRWTYFEYQLVLLFVDETGFGRYRMTPASRIEYLRILSRIRSES